MKKLITLRYFLLLLMLGSAGVSWGQQFWNTNGTPNIWTNSNWGTSGAGPFTNAWVNGSDVRFTANSSVTFATATVGNVTVDPGVTVTVTNAGTLSFTGGTVKTYDIGAGSTLNWASQVVTATSAAGIIKNGTGTLNLNALNWTTNMNGGFTLNNGILAVSGNKALGNGSLTLNGGNLQSSGNRSYTPTSLIFGGNFTLSGTGDADWNAATTISLGSGTRTITNSTTSGIRSFLGVISGTGGIIYTGTGLGSIILATGNTYSGKTQLSGGTVSGPGSNGTLFGADPGSFIADQLTFNGGIFLPTSDINFSGNRGITFTGTTSEINTGSHLVTLTSVCTGSGGFTKSGSGTILFAGAHTFSGPVTLNNGTLKLNASGTYPDASPLLINGGGTFDMNSFSETIGSLAGSGPVTSSSAGNIVLSTGGNNSSTTFSGVMSNGTATSLGLTKEGSGTFTLTGNNTLTGPITVNNGTLKLSRFGGTLPAAQSVTVNTGGVLQISENQSLTNVTLDAGATLTVDAGKTLSISGTLTVNTGANINGTGTVSYSGVGNLVYNGTSSLTAGIEWPTVSVPASVSINTGATVVLTANRTTTVLLTIDGTLDATTVSITGTGTVNINGTLKTANPAGYTGTGATFTGASPTLGSSSTVDYNAAGNQVVTTAGPVYANLTASVSGTKTPPNKVYISGTLTISGSAIFDGTNQEIGGATTNLTMTGTSRFKTGGTTGAKPDAGGTYNLTNTTTIEFTNNAGTQEDIRLAPTYANIDISGSNVGLSGTLSSITLKSGTTFKVTSTGTFNVKSSTGFTGATGTAVSSTNSPTIVLLAGSTINYNDIAQPLTPRSDYKNLTISGSGAKTASGAFNVAETFTRSGDASLATTSPTYGTNATLAYVDAGAGRLYNVGLEWPTTNPPTNLTVNLSGTGTRQVIMQADRTLAGNVALTAGELSINGNTLTANGAITGTGTITGSNTSNLTLGGAAGTLNFTQTSAATSSLKNLTLGAAGTAKIGNDLYVYGNIDVNNPTTNAMDFDGKHVTLKSLSTGTATIDELNSSGSNLTGATNVTMERWIPATNPLVLPLPTGRRYQLLTPTVTTTSSIQANWMEGGQVTSAGGFSDPNPGYGTHITGSNVLTNHLDRTQTDQPSLFTTTNGVTPAYTAFTNANGTLNALTGYFLFVRGGRDVSMSLYNTNQAANGWVNLPSSNTTLRATGTIQKGQITAFTNPFVGGTGAWNLVTNPYPAPIDWSKVNRANVNGSYKYWDPHNGNRGGFIDVDNTGASTPSASGNQYIQPGQAFFVIASGAGTPTITMEESDKAVGNDNTPVFLMPPKNFSASIFYYEGGINRRLADGVRAVFDNAYSPAFNGEEDALDLANWDENMAINRDGSRLVVDRRPEITRKDTMFLLIDRLQVANYELEFTGQSFINDNITATLIDNFTGNRTGLSTLGTTVVPITVSSNPASAASNRFYVVFENTGGPLPIDMSSVKAYEKGSGIQVDWEMNTEQDMDKYEVEKSTDGRHFTAIGTVSSRGNSNTKVQYGWFDANPVTGTNYYRIHAIEKSGAYKNSEIVRVQISKGGSTDISLYPNPFEGSGFNLQLNKFEAGTYTLTMYNSLGQQVYNTTLMHSGGSATQYISLGKDLAAGTYTVKITGGGTTLTRTITKK